MDIGQHLKLRKTALIEAMLPANKGGGRFLRPDDEGQNRIVISARTAADFPDSQRQPRRVGDKLRIGEESFEIVGIFDSGSLVLDRIIVMGLDTARRLLGVKQETVSAFNVEPREAEQRESLKSAIERTLPEVEARSASDMAVNATRVMNELDVFLLMVISLALVVGCVGIINTMLMSTLERYVEFGILRTNGWKRTNVLQLVLAESSYLGVLSGVLGCLLALVGVWIANLFLTGGLKLQETPAHLALGVSLALLMGVLGGLYPACAHQGLRPWKPSAGGPTESTAHRGVI